jgi:hypothetical protein
MFQLVLGRRRIDDHVGRDEQVCRLAVKDRFPARTETDHLARQPIAAEHLDHRPATLVGP